MSLLSVRGLTVSLGGHVRVDGLDLDVAPGKVVALVGRSGSGKSLTARALIGLAPPGAMVTGSIRLDGRELTGLGEADLRRMRGSGLGLVFQEPSTALDPIMPIGEQVAEGLRLQGRSRRAARGEAQAWLARVGLDPSIVPPSRRAHQLSGGQRQRVAIAAAAALRPAVLIADEPTTALDPATQAEVIALLASLVRDPRGDAMALLLITHDLALVAGWADRLVVLEAGRVIAAGPTAQVLASPQAEVQALVAAAGAPVAAPSPAAEGAPLLQARGLRRTYRPNAETASNSPNAVGVQAVDLELRRGETLAVIGETGAGKSTLLRLVLGLERPDAGEVWLAGERFNPGPPARQRALRRRIQPVFQDPAGSFDPRWRVGEIVAEPLGLLTPALTPEAVRARVADVLARVGLAADAADRPARAFSGGQRQRIALARALAAGPQVLVLDEATSALDVASRAEVLTLIAALQREDGLACLVVAHDLTVVRALAHRVAVLSAGRIVEDGPTAEVLANPRDPRTRALVAASPDLAAVLAACAAARP